MRRRRLLLASLALAALALAGCDASPLPGPATASPSGPLSTELPRDTPVPSRIQPAVVVAGLDVDGVHATVSGYVAGIIEDGGKCEFVLTGPRSATQSVDTVGAANSSSTSCGSAQVLRTDLSTGEWKVVLRYTALSGVTSISQPATMEIP